MDIRNIRHKGLRALAEKDSGRGLPANYLTKIRDILEFLIVIEDIDEVYDLSKYKPHMLSGKREGTFSLSVTANWRITFEYDAEKDELFDLNFEDYH